MSIDFEKDSPKKFKNFILPKMKINYVAITDLSGYSIKDINEFLDKLMTVNPTVRFKMHSTNAFSINSDSPNRYLFLFFEDASTVIYGLAAKDLAKNQHYYWKFPDINNSKKVISFAKGRSML